jgi:hypothetical protein
MRAQEIDRKQDRMSRKKERLWGQRGQGKTRQENEQCLLCECSHLLVLLS